MTPYRIAVVDDLERDRAWLAKKLADYMARERLEYELTAFASGEAFSAALEQGQRFNLVFMDIYHICPRRAIRKAKKRRPLSFFTGAALNSHQYQQ